MQAGLLAVVYAPTSTGGVFCPLRRSLRCIYRFSDNKKPGGASNSNRVCLMGDSEIQINQADTWLMQ